MDKQTHMARHIELHKGLDELVADFFTHNNHCSLSATTVMQLIEWSHQQTINPTADKDIEK